MNDASQTLCLSDEVTMPKVGLGTYLITDDEARDVVGRALDEGYRHIDTAQGYRNEEGVGAAVRSGLERLSLARDDVFVTTKLWPGNADWGQEVLTRQGTIDAMDASLTRLGLDHVDLYLIHTPSGGERRVEQWDALVELQRQGKARAIGVSNYLQHHFEEIAAAGLPAPQANQIELHPWSQRPDLTAYLADNNIGVIAYSSLVPLSTWRAAEGHDSAKSEQMKADSTADDSPFAVMAHKYGVSEAQLLLRWAVQNNYAVVPKSTKVDRMRQNRDLFSFAIDDDDMALLAGLDRGGGVAWAAGDPTMLG